MARGSNVLETVPNPQAKGPGQFEPGPLTGINGLFRPESNPPGALKMCRLKTLKNSALKSIVARSPKILVFFLALRFYFVSPIFRHEPGVGVRLRKTKEVTDGTAARLW